MLGPVFPVELTTTLRRERYFVLRVAYVAILALALWFTLQSSSVLVWFDSEQGTQYRLMAQFANEFFQTFVVLQLLAVLAVTPAIVAGTIAEERSRRTIEYLFVTHLRDTEIVLGKLVARLVPITLLLAAGLPVLAIVMTLGGIQPRLLAQCFCLTASTLVWVTSLSICVSVFYAKARDAVTRTYSLLFLLLAVIPFCTMLWQAQGRGPLGGPWGEFLLAGFHPLYIFAGTIAVAAWAPVDTSWQILGAMAAYHGVWAAACVAIAIWRLRPAHLNARARALPVRSGRQRWRRPVGNDAMLWKELYVEGRPSRFRRVRSWLTGIALLAWIGVVIWLVSLNDLSSDEYYSTAMGISILLSCLSLLMIVSRAASSISNEREQDTWIMLLSTPLEPHEFLRAKAIGTLYAYRGVLAALAVLWLPLLYFYISAWAVIFFSLLVLTPLAAFSCLLGMRFSLRSSSSVRAQAGSVAVALLIGGGYLFCCMPLVLGASLGDEGLVCLAACAPYLLSFPWMWFWPSGFGGAADEGLGIVTYELGVIGYALGAALLWVSLWMSFNRLAGRAVQHEQAVLAPRPWAEAADGVNQLPNS